MEAMISVAQCTPEMSLPIAINIEKETAKIVDIAIANAFLVLLWIWKDNVGMTERTSNVVEEG